LIRDEFADCIRSLEHGMALNTDNPALNVDMQLIVDRVKARSIEGAPDSSATEGDIKEEPESHLFLNAYTGGKVH
jgi:hypothetical protein